jgi:hypothetical protein
MIQSEPNGRSNTQGADGIAIDRSIPTLHFVCPIKVVRKWVRNRQISAFRREEISRDIAMMMLFRNRLRQKVDIRRMNAPESRDLNRVEALDKPAKQRDAGPAADGYRWRFLVTMGLFFVWLAYLAWVAWKVIVQ